MFQFTSHAASWQLLCHPRASSQRSSGNSQDQHSASNPSSTYHSASEAITDKRWITVTELPSEESDSSQWRHSDHLTRPHAPLNTIQVWINSPTAVSLSVRTLLDTGSAQIFISENVVSQLQFRRTHSKLPLLGIGDTHSERTRGLVRIKLYSIHSSSYSLNFEAHVLPQLTACLPSVNHKTTE